MYLMEYIDRHWIVSYDNQKVIILDRKKDTLNPMIMFRQVEYAHPIVRVEWHLRVFTVWSTMPIRKAFGPKTALEIPFVFREIGEMVRFMRWLMDMLNGGRQVCVEPSGVLSLIKPITKAVSFGSFRFLKSLWSRTKTL